MSDNLVWQYVTVSVLILAAVVRMAYLLRKQARKDGSCAGCSLSEKCRDYKRHDADKKPSKDKYKKEAMRCCCDAKEHDHHKS